MSINATYGLDYAHKKCKVPRFPLFTSATTTVISYRTNVKPNLYNVAGSFGQSRGINASLLGPASSAKLVLGFVIEKGP